jgi:hypothetical protein
MSAVPVEMMLSPELLPQVRTAQHSSSSSQTQCCIACDACAASRCQQAVADAGARHERPPAEACLAWLWALQAFNTLDDGRREIQMSDLNEDSLDGELPFLPRDTRDSEDGGGERQRRSSAGGLPTHEAPPPRGFLARRYVMLGTSASAKQSVQERRSAHERSVCWK